MNPKEIPHQPLTHHHDDKSALKYLKVSKVILPSIIGLGVVLWLMSRQLDINELSKLKNSGHTIFWVLMAMVMYFLRHLFYSWRLRVITDYAFSWLKSMQLIVIWEFSTAVSPTSVGGSAVAFFYWPKKNFLVPRPSLQYYTVW
ncbi:MAG: flippase-like domain-containing protein [Saprospiraceae bacterium]|nr:flippase-like domain-containing protein [Saprospiraceae bacterium]